MSRTTMSGILVCVWLFCCGCLWDLVRVNLRFPAVGLRNVWLCVKASKQDSQARAQSQECLAVGRFHDARLRRTAYRYKPPAAVWARWLGTHPLFRAYIIGLVVLSSLVLAVQVELPPERWEAHRAIERMELFILLSFIVEIGQRQTHCFHVHTSDGMC